MLLQLLIRHPSNEDNAKYLFTFRAERSGWVPRDPIRVEWQEQLFGGKPDAYVSAECDSYETSRKT